jgi:parallel beta-helix repeat protein
MQSVIDDAPDYSTIFFTKSSYNFTELTVTGKAGLRLEGASTLKGQLNILSSTDITVRGLRFNRGRTVANANAIELQEVSGVFIESVTFIGVDKCVYVRPFASVQHVKRCVITGCRTRISDSSLFTASEINNLPSVYFTQGNPNYFYYADNTAPAAPAQYQTGDVTIANNNPVNANIAHIYALGQDGTVINGNTFFFPGGFYRSQVKTNNIYMKKASWIVITGNEVFEAGAQGIYLLESSNLNITGNVIAWPGQRDAVNGHGIQIGPETSDPVHSSVIASNNIRIPTGHGVLLDASCNFVAITGNVTTTPGANNFYYGDGTQPQGATAVPAISGTRYGVNVPATCYQIAVTGNINMLANNLTPKSTSIAYSAAIFSGPLVSGNIEISGNAQEGGRLNVNAITDNNLDVSLNNALQLQVVAGGTVNTISGGANGQTLIINNESTAVTFTHNDSVLFLSGAVNATLGFRKTITFKNRSGIWYEISRTV